MPDTSTGVARLRQVARQIHPVGHHANAGGGDKHAIALALLDHLGVAGDHRHASLTRGLRQRADNARQISQRQAFFQNKTHRQV